MSTASEEYQCPKRLGLSLSALPPVPQSSHSARASKQDALDFVRFPVPFKISRRPTEYVVHFLVEGGNVSCFWFATFQPRQAVFVVSLVQLTADIRMLSRYASAPWWISDTALLMAVSRFAAMGSCLILFPF